MFEELFQQAAQNLTTIPFSAAIFMLIAAIVTVFINIGLAQRRGDRVDLLAFAKSMISVFITIVILVILSAVGKMFTPAAAALALVFVPCLRYILLSLQFTGLRFPALVAFLDLISTFFSPARIKAALKKEKDKK